MGRSRSPGRARDRDRDERRGDRKRRSRERGTTRRDNRERERSRDRDQDRDRYRERDRDRHDDRDRYDDRDRERNREYDREPDRGFDDFGRRRERSRSRERRRERSESPKLQTEKKYDDDVSQWRRDADELLRNAAASIEEVPQEGDPEELSADAEETAMMAAMGIPVGFNTTQGKEVSDPNAKLSGVHKKTTRQARQYMNRRGGFNRPLPAEKTGEKINAC